MDASPPSPEAADGDPWRRPPRYQPMVIVLAAVAVGIVADRYFPLVVHVWWAVAAVAWLGWLVLWRLRYDTAAALVDQPGKTMSKGVGLPGR